jgi:hypothetical protein
MVAYGWQAVAQVWASPSLVMAVVFWFTTKDDPVIAARRAERREGPSMASQLEPLKNLQVWRFSLYYFFVFGAFVALALWLPRYLIGVYGLDIRVAGMLGAAYSVPASALSAPMAACSPTSYGARASCTGPSGLGDLHLHAVLSADRIRHPRHQRPDPFSTEMGRHPFTSSRCSCSASS